MVLNGNCIKLQVHRQRIVTMSVWEDFTKLSLRMSKNSMISAHMARLTRRSCERESFVMPRAVGSSQRPRIIINMVVCSIRSVHLSAETISTFESSCKRTEIIIGWLAVGCGVVSFCLCSSGSLEPNRLFTSRSSFINWGEEWVGGFRFYHQKIYKIPS